MSGHKYLADTNAFIFLLDKHPALKPLVDRIEIKQKHKIKIPDAIIRQRLYSDQIA